MRKHLLGLPLLLATTPSIAQPAEEAAAPAVSSAETPAQQVIRTYLPEDFSRFAPRTALDMLNQVPGFSVDQGETDRRGLGQATSNVLINGQRVAGKSNNAVAELGRISADSVTRIDIVDGATLNLPGLSGQVANVIAETGGDLSGSWAWEPQKRLNGSPARLTAGRFTLNGSSGNLEYSLDIRNESGVAGSEGPEQVFTEAGTILDLREEFYEATTEQPKISLGLRHESTSGNIANLNASAQIYHFTNEEISLRSGPGVPDRNRIVDQTEREWNFELSGDYEFALGSGRMKLIGLRRFEHSPFTQQLVEMYADGSPSTGSRFERNTDETETILRGEYGWRSGSSDWQIAVEGAYNLFEDETFLGALLGTGGFGLAPFSQTVIDEKRAEALLTWGRPLSADLTLQVAAGGEYSRLSQTRPINLTRTFYRPKGFVSLAWRASPRLDVSARIEREVGQLNFYDFAASANLGNETSNAGNPNLVPTQFWNGRVEARRNLGAYGTLTAAVYGTLLQDVVDIIPIGANGQSPGNLDSARRYGGSVSGTLNFDPFGLAGAKLDFTVALQDSEIKDQLTGLPRPINSNPYRRIELNYRHDIQETDWAYGASFFQSQSAFTYRLDERARIYYIPNNLSIFVEHKNVGGMKVQLSFNNLLDTRETFTRIVHAGRRTNPVLFTEYRERKAGPSVTLSLSGEF